MGHIALVFSPDGTTLAASGHGNSVNLWDTVTWVQRRVLEGKTASANDADFSPDGRLLATAHGDGTIRLWDVATGAIAATIQGHPKAASTVAFAPDGRRVASGGDDRKAKVWDVTTGAELASFSGHSNDVYDLAFAPDGRTIASVGGAYRGPNSAEVKLWNSLTGEETGNLAGHTSLVTAVAYFPDGKRLATASDDRTIKLWDIETHEDVFTLRGHTSGVLSLAISRDGSQIVSGSIDYSAKTWSTATPEPVMAARLSIRRAAVERVQSLLAEHLLKAEVIKVLREDKSLSPRLRAAAIEVAEHRTENASGLYQAGWLAALRPGGHLNDYQMAVRRLKAACQVVIDDPERYAQYSRALALAYHRAGQPGQAIKTIENLATTGHAARIVPDPGAGRASPDPGAGRASPDPGAGRGSPDPALQNAVPLDLAIVTLASAELGDKAGARAALDALSTLIKTAAWTNNQEAQLLYREAEGVVGSTP
jgi:sugar lactone lactonase YvrE